MTEAEEFLMWFAIKYPEEYKVKVKNFRDWKYAIEVFLNEG